MSEEIVFPGALVDERTPEEQEKDYRFEEVDIAAGAPVVWEEKKVYAKYPLFFQNGNSSCVANACVKALGINNLRDEKVFVNLSRRDFYSRRINIPGEGMNGPDAAKIGISFGSTLESLMPSDGMHEVEMNKADDRKPSYEMIGKIYRAKNWISLPLNDIEAIASAIQQGYGVVLFFRWTVQEWDQPIPKILGTAMPYGHAVCAVDFTLKDGKKAIIIDDSWGKDRGIDGQRILTEEWFDPANKRHFWAHIFVDMANLGQNEALQPSDRPKATFDTDLAVNAKSDAVAQLQRCLGYLKDDAGYLFPLTQAPTGFYGGITRKAVERYQALRKIPVTGKLDETTRKYLNQDFD